MADSSSSTGGGGGSIRGPYKPLEKARLKQQIYNLILDGHTYQSIMNKLHIPERTFYRYIQAIEAEEKDFLKESISREVLRFQYRLCRDRLLADRLEINEWLKQNPESKDRAELKNLSAEIAAAICRIYNEGPAVLLSHSAIPDNLTRYKKLIIRGGEDKNKKEEEEEQQQQEELQLYDHE